MTRDEFIDGYLGRSQLEKYRTSDGFHVPRSQRRYALPCHCGEEVCKGWAMIIEELIEEHMQRDGAPPAISAPS